MTESKFTIKFVGPITRSTVGGTVPDRDEEVLNDVLHWIWSWNLQVRRHYVSTKEQDWGATDLEYRRSCSAASYDEHMIAVAGCNLVKAISKASIRFPEIQIAEKTCKGLSLLRNLYEHWDEQRDAFQSADSQKKRSGKEFVEMFPKGKPWSITYTGKDWLLGGIVPIKAITTELNAIEAKVIEIETERKRCATKKGTT